MLIPVLNEQMMRGPPASSASLSGYVFAKEKYFHTLDGEVAVLRQILYSHSCLGYQTFMERGPEND